MKNNKISGIPMIIGSLALSLAAFQVHAAGPAELHASASASTAPTYAKAERNRDSQLSPAEQMQRFGAGVFFTHQFEKLPLAKPPSYSWYIKSSAMFGENLKIILLRGQDQLELNIRGYKGPATYNYEQTNARLTVDGQTYQTNIASGDSIKVEKDEGGWISGKFNASFYDRASTQIDPIRLENGIFRVNKEQPKAAQALMEATNKPKPLLEAFVPLLKSLVP